MEIRMIAKKETEGSDLNFHVYLLIDPTTELIHYVGQSRRGARLERTAQMT